MISTLSSPPDTVALAATRCPLYDGMAATRNSGAVASRQDDQPRGMAVDQDAGERCRRSRATALTGWPSGRSSSRQRVERPKYRLADQDTSGAAVIRQVNQLPPHTDRVDCREKTSARSLCERYRRPRDGDQARREDAAGAGASAAGRLLGCWRAEGPATATGLAQRLGESSGTTSWHLRQLADHSLIEQDTERGNKRERWWKAAYESTELRMEDFRDDEESAGALNAYLYEIASGVYRRITGSWPRTGRSPGGVLVMSTRPCRSRRTSSRRCGRSCTRCRQVPPTGTAGGRDRGGADPGISTQTAVGVKTPLLALSRARRCPRSARR